jgi:asparagine synthase (glutamine-hydrolysing)
MCGWVGMWRPGGKLPGRGRLERMRDLMRSRGPDDAGLWMESDIALAHRRLSILDLSSAGHQPMMRNGIVAAYNGEIYNYPELRLELESQGELFSGESDTELLPIGLRAWGFETLLRKIDGMFSFWLYDSNIKTAYLARDRVGKKPLYYTFLENGFLAGSDVKALLAGLETRPEADLAVLPLYLYHGFIPAPWTGFRGISKLPPATAMVVRQVGGQIESRQFPYWQLAYDVKRAISSHEAEEEVDNLLRSSVRRRLLSDVPVGAFLSGGVDSSAVVSYAAELSPGIKTFSIGFHHDSHNELPFARRVAARCGTEHHEEILEVDVLGDLPRILWNHGEPFADSSAVPSHAVAAAAAKHVSVVLTGDGGDEAFAGYPTARAAWLASYYKKLLGNTSRRRIERAMTALCSGRDVPRWMAMAWTLSRYGGRPDGSVYLDPDLWRDDLRGGLLLDSVKRLSVFSPAGWHESLLRNTGTASEFDAMLALDMQVRLPNDYLVKVDVATMASSLEARSPLLDTRLLEFAAMLPREILLPRGESKGLLKRLTANRVPREVVYRPKAGFALPLAAWLRGPFRHAVEHTLLSPAALERGAFQPEAVRRFVGEHMSGKFDHAGRLWTLLVWETWCRVFMDRPLEAPAADPGFLAEAA